VYALSGRDGSKLWEFKTGRGVSSSPALADLNGDAIPDAVVGSDDGKVYALSGRDGSKLWEFKTGGEVTSSPALADLDGDTVPDAIVGSRDTKVYALSGRDGATLWEFKTGSGVRSSPALADLNGDGIPDAVVGSWDTKVYVLSGRDGDLLATLQGMYASVHGKRIFTGSSDWSVRAFPFASAPSAPAALARADAWRALLRRATEEIATRPDAFLYYYRGLARLRLGDNKTSLSDFIAAAKLGLRSPELHAAWMEICPDLPEIHPQTPLLWRGKPIPDLKGDAPHVLILRGRYDEALEKLPKAETWDWQALALRALAKRMKGDVDGARADLDIAVKLNPWSRDLKRQLDGTARR
ncbi:MAG: PQQ-binding-like beta-propeller repeat protein, partial [Planctomycetes bacterium]|nr:PQQ-binding-like beta-propeller repeat protein [Planctomycetota bacterium]